MKNMTLNRKQAGFTLIELIMVIVILGVLSAFALPRFADLGGNARAASINGLAASIRAAANIAHAQALANGTGAAVSVTLEGQAITMANFYPTADAAGIGQAAQVSATDYASSTSGSTITYTITGTTAGECEVSYTAAGSGAIPTYAIDVANC